MTDSEAVLALRRGDEEGMEVLVRTYQLRAHRVAFQITRDRQGAEDIVADSFLVVYRNVQKLDPDRPFEPWFLRVVVNRAISETRRTERFQRFARLLPAAKVSAPEEVAERNERSRAIHEAVGSLPAHERAALSLRYFLDLMRHRSREPLIAPSGP